MGRFGGETHSVYAPEEGLVRVIYKFLVNWLAILQPVDPILDSLESLAVEGHLTASDRRGRRHEYRSGDFVLHWERVRVRLLRKAGTMVNRHFFRPIPQNLKIYNSLVRNSLA